MRATGAMAAAGVRGIHPEEFLPRVLPAGWRRFTMTGGEIVDSGAAFASAEGIVVIVSAGIELDGRRWLHVSCSGAKRLPSWDDLRAVKDIFIGRDREAYQVLPKAEKHVNIMPHCLHLWCCLDGAVLPDFTRGSAEI
jgi:hypothetical protein